MIIDIHEVRNMIIDNNAFINMCEATRQDDLQQLVQIVYDILMVRQGEVLDEKLARERASNIIQAIGYAVDMNILRGNNDE